MDYQPPYPCYFFFNLLAINQPNFRLRHPQPCFSGIHFKNVRPHLSFFLIYSSSRCIRIAFILMFFSLYYTEERPYTDYKVIPLRSKLNLKNRNKIQSASSVMKNSETASDRFKLSKVKIGLIMQQTIDR